MRLFPRLLENLHYFFLLVAREFNSYERHNIPYFGTNARVRRRTLSMIHRYEPHVLSLCCPCAGFVSAADVISLLFDSTGAAALLVIMKMRMDYENEKFRVSVRASSQRNGRMMDGAAARLILHPSINPRQTPEIPHSTIRGISLICILFSSY